MRRERGAKDWENKWRMKDKFSEDQTVERGEEGRGGIRAEGGEQKGCQW